MEGIVCVSRVEDPQNIDFPKVKGQLTLGRYTSILGPSTLFRLIASPEKTSF